MRTFKQRIKTLRNIIKINVLSALAYSYIWPLDKSLRFKRINYNPTIKPAIYAVWHGWQYGLLNVPRKDLNLLVSYSTDGEIISRISKGLGYPIIRGSKGRKGTEALRGILNALKKGESVAYTVDGPKGPVFKVKDGIIKIAQMSQVPIIPLVPDAKWKTQAKSWDKYQIPFILTKAVNVLGDPIHIPEELTDEEMEFYRLKLENKLFELDKKAKELINQ